jgi:hypothetical protein
MKSISMWLIALFLLSCASTKTQKTNDLDLYLSYLTGDFDNQLQIDQQTKQSKVTHPFAKHVTRVITSRVANVPTDFKGVFVLEESYYTNSNQETQVKPYIFMFLLNEEGKVVLHSIGIPTRIDKKTFRNDNSEWTLDFSELKESASFKPATYAKTERGFYIKAINELPGGVKFTLEETIGNGFLEVMELAERGGKRLTPYETPLQYSKKNENRH